MIQIDDNTADDNEPKIALLEKTTITRKILGMTIPLFIVFVIAIAGIVSGATIYLSSKRTTFSWTEVGLTTDMPSSEQASGGSYYEFNYTIETPTGLKGIDTINYTLELCVTPNSTTLTDNEVKVQILDNDSNVLAENTSVNADGKICAIKPDYLFNVPEAKQGKLRLQFNNTADNDTYYLDFSVKAGSFTWKN